MGRFSFFLTVTSWMALLFVSCERNQTFDYPLVLTGEVKDLTDTSVTFTGKITYAGSDDITESGFQWGLNYDQGLNLNTEGTQLSIGDFSLNNHVQLIPGKTYYYRAYVKSGTVVVYGLLKHFSTPGLLNPGRWIKIFDNLPDLQSWYSKFGFAFTINGHFYFIEEGSSDLYVFNFDNSRLDRIMTNSIFSQVDLCLMHNGFAYLFVNNRFYRFDPLSLTLEPCAVLNDISDWIRPTGFVIEDAIYIGLGLESDEVKSDFWKYDINNNDWQSSASLPGPGRILPVFFAARDKGYVFGGYQLDNYNRYYDFWRFDPNISQWERLKDIDFQGYSMQAIACQNNGYVRIDGAFFEYNTIYEYWERRANYSQYSDYSILVSANNTIFKLLVETDGVNNYGEIWKYEF